MGQREGGREDKDKGGRLKEGKALKNGKAEFFQSINPGLDARDFLGNLKMGCSKASEAPFCCRRLMSREFEHYIITMILLADPVMPFLSPASNSLYRSQVCNALTFTEESVDRYSPIRLAHLAPLAFSISALHGRDKNQRLSWEGKKTSLTASRRLL